MKPQRSTLIRVPLVVFLSCLSPLGCACAGQGVLPEVLALPEQTGLPDPLKMFDGSPVATAEDWVNQRRPELKELFRHYMYGHLPPPPAKVDFTVARVDKKALGGKATLKEVTIQFWRDMPVIHLLVVIPNQRTSLAPVFVGLNFNGNHTVLPDPCIALPTAWMPNNTLYLKKASSTT